MRRTLLASLATLVTLAGAVPHTIEPSARRTIESPKLSARLNGSADALAARHAAASAAAREACIRAVECKRAVAKAPATTTSSHELADEVPA